MAKKPPTNTRKKKEERFLAHLSEVPNVSRAAKISGFDRSDAYRKRQQDESFAAAWDDALEKGLDAMEDEAIRRGCEGYEEPVFHKGEQVATIRKYSDNLMMFMLKGRRGDKFKDRFQGDINATTQQNHTHNVSDRVDQFFQSLKEKDSKS